MAIEKENLDIINLLLQNTKINSNAKLIDCYESENDTREIKMPIHIAIENEQLEIVKILTEFAGIYINENVYMKDGVMVEEKNMKKKQH